MSSLLIMPGSPEFNQTLAQTKKCAPRAPRAAPPPVDLIGRTLMLNTALAKTFQCGGFVLGPRRPVAVVDYQAQQFPIRKALEDGRLVDVTGKDMTKGIKGKGGQTTAVSEEDTGKRVYLATDRHGNLYVATPRNKKETARFESQLRKTGRLKDIDFTQEATGFVGGITEEIVETNLPVQKVKKHVRTARKPSRSVRSGK